MCLLSFFWEQQAHGAGRSAHTHLNPITSANISLAKASQVAEAKDKEGGTPTSVVGNPQLHGKGHEYRTR